MSALITLRELQLNPIPLFSDSKSLDTVSTKALFTRNVCLSKMGSMVTNDGVHIKRLNCQEQGSKDERNTQTQTLRVNGTLGTFNADIYTWSHSHMATVNAKAKVIFLTNSFVAIFKRNMFLLFVKRYQQFISVLLQAVSLSH